MSSTRRTPLLAAAAALTALALTGCTGSAFEAAARLAGLDPVSVDSISATEGSLVGGETVEIAGVGLTDATAVEVDGVDATILSQTNTALAFTVPHSVDYVSGETVPVTVLDGTDAVAEFDYTYLSLTAVDRQLEYAFAHWNSYNTAYYGDFNAWGGDCINFVSQTLVARGWVPTSDWFNDAQEDWAAAFVHVPSFDEWLSEHPEYGAVRMGLDQIDDVKIGDVVLFDWEGDGSLDHAQVVSGIDQVDGQTDVLMVGHNVDSTYRSITAALAEQGHESAQVYFWSIP